MTIRDDAQSLISLANTFVEGGIGASATAGVALGGVGQGLQLIGHITAESVQQATQLLGDGHAAVGNIQASGAAVITKVEEIHGLVGALQGAFLELDHAINTHGNTMGAAGHQVMQGGS